MFQKIGVLGIIVGFFTAGLLAAPSSQRETPAASPGAPEKGVSSEFVQSARQLTVAEDAYEPNDSQAAAWPITPGVYSNLGCNNDDWFKVNVAEGKYLWVIVAYADTNANIYLEVYDKDKFREGAFSGSGKRQVCLGPLAEGDYFIRVYPYSGSAIYSLEVKVKDVAELASIGGRVTNTSDAGIGNIEVILFDTGSSGNWACPTDGNGEYSFQGRAPGNYRIKFLTYNAGNYVSEWYNGKSSWDTADLIAANVGLTTVNARLAMGGIVSGRVTDPSGVGISSIGVDVCDENQHSVGFDLTDENGDYSVQRLPAGDFKVDFSSPQNAYGGTNYVSEWYNDKRSFVTADPISVIAGQTTTGINAQLTPYGTIGGRVTDISGSGIYNVRVEIINSLQAAYTDSNGNYSTQGLFNGNYKVHFISDIAGNFVSEWYNDKASFDMADSVSVSIGQKTTADAQLATGGIIGGRVTDTSGSGIRSVEVFIYNLNNTRENSSVTDNNGDYSIRGLLPGNYKIYFDTSYTANYPSEWYNDKGSFDAADQVTVATGQTTSVNAVLAGIPSIGLSKTTFNFGTEQNGTPTPDETAVITNTGAGTLNWTATSSSGWLGVSPGSGTGAGLLTIGILNTNLAPGTRHGTITISAPNATNSPRTITVAYTVKQAGADSPPFGNFATPADGSTVRSSIPVSGWALDDIGMVSVKIYRGTGTADRVYIGNAVFVEGARPDIKAAYPTYPQNSKAGWGYMLLTNFLPGGGNGRFNLMAYARDTGGHEVLLGSKAITCDNANAVKPFGAIDTPTQGGTAWGNNYVNFGWALTPQPNSIPTNGRSIYVWVDGSPKYRPTYDNYRADIATLFPGYANSNGAVGYVHLDTTEYADGLHTIVWSVTDNAGNVDGIGSRYFSVQNAVGGSSGERNEETAKSSEGASSNFMNRRQAIRSLSEIFGLPQGERNPVFIKRGFGNEQFAETAFPETDGAIRIEIPAVSRIAIYLKEEDAGETTTTAEARGRRILSESAAGSESSHFTAYELVSDELHPLPVGASFDARDGVLYWQPGPGFLGEYQFIIVDSETMTSKTIKITITGDRP